MKYILSTITLVLVLISVNAAAQGNTEDNKVMDRLNAGAYSGPYFAKVESDPLVILSDGNNIFKISKSALLKEVHESWIDKMEVLKDAKATERFGEAGKDGVVIITLKKDVEEANLYLENIKKNYKK